MSRQWEISSYKLKIYPDFPANIGATLNLDYVRFLQAIYLRQIVHYTVVLLRDVRMMFLSPWVTLVTEASPEENYSTSRRMTKKRSAGAVKDCGFRIVYSNNIWPSCSRTIKKSVALKQTLKHEILQKFVYSDLPLRITFKWTPFRLSLFYQLNNTWYAIKNHRRILQTDQQIVELEIYHPISQGPHVKLSNSATAVPLNAAPCCLKYCNGTPGLQ